MEIKRSERCFGCGEKNPIGLRLKVEATPDYEIAYFTPSLNHEGYEGIVHGGIISSLLDEVMSWACLRSGCQAVTAELRVRFRHPAKLGQRLKVVARVVEARGRLVITEGEVCSQFGQLLASAQGRYMRL